MDHRLGRVDQRPHHGQQFRARFIRTAEPSSTEGIEKYMGSGMIRGIGPVYARKLVRAFGEKVFDVIEAEPERLREVTGIGKVRGEADHGCLGRVEGCSPACRPGRIRRTFVGPD